MNAEESRVDRAAFSIGSLDDDDARGYWRGRSRSERMAALEHLRQVMYGYDPASERLSRLLEVVELGAR